MNLVSVIIPYYKKKQYISKTLNSVRIQSYRNLEIILIYDDKNKDDLKFIKKLALKDKRIKLVINKYNHGVGNARNLGVKISKGKYIAFLDADDIWLKHKISKQFTFMIKNRKDFTHTSYSVVNDNNLVISKRTARDFLCLDDLIKSCDIGLSTVMLKKSLLKKNKFPTLKTKEDFVLWLRLFSNNIKIYGLDLNLVLWKKGQNSLSSSTIQKILDEYRVYNVYMKYNFIKSIYYLICLSFNYLKK